MAIFTRIMLREILDFFMLRPQASRVQRDLDHMRHLTSAWEQELVPWNNHELELLSYRISNPNPRKWTPRTNEFRGLFTSVYNEPLAIINYKKYNPQQIIWRVRIQPHELLYIRNNQQVKVFLDSVQVATIVQDVMYAIRQQAPIGRIDYQHGPNPSVEVRGKDIGLINLPNPDLSINQRVIQLFSRPNEDDEIVFLALVFWFMMKKTFA